MDIDVDYIHRVSKYPYFVAIACLKNRGYYVRFAVKEDRAFMLTMDYVPSRLSLYIKRGLIYKITRG